MSAAIKGYVVRYTNDRGTFYVTAPKWLDDFTIGSRADEGSLFETLGGATAAARHPRRVSDVAIFRVHDDGREERLPSYEEALQRSQDVASILTDGVPAIMRSSAPATREQIGAAACQMLKAIERALSVLRGSEAPLATLDIERRRLAAKGGA